MSDTAAPRLEPGDTGTAVADVQSRLAALGYTITPAERGVFGPETESAVKVFQIRRGLSPDGVVEGHTWLELVEAGWTFGSRMLYLRRPPMRGDDVRELQMRLNALGFDAGKQDGIFGRATHDAVREFQHNIGQPADGIAGHETFEALGRLRRRIGVGSKAELRDRLAREGAAGLEGRTVLIDPGHGGTDTGALQAPWIPESYVVFRVAEAAAARLGRLGGRPLLSRAVQQGPDLDRRCEFANAERADVALSVHLGCRPEPGPTVTFWSADRTHSAMGKELAEDVAEALRPRLGNAQVLGRNLPFLRQTQMPAVVVDVAAPGAESLLAEDAYLTALGSAVAAGIERYFTCAG